MKKRLLGYAFMLICSIGFIASCNKDDGDSTDYAKDIVGTYKGTLIVNIPSLGAGADSSLQKITLSYTAENKVKMSLRNFSFSNMTVGDIIVDNVPVKSSENGIAIVSTTASVPLSIGKVTVVVSGEVVGKDLELSISVSEAPAVNEVDVKFFGAKLDVEESSEALITSMTFSDSIVIGQPVISGSNIVFQIVDTAVAEQLTSLAPTITISAGASIYPASGVPQDFSQGSVIYTVTAQDSITKTEYTVSFERGKKYTFENWVSQTDDNSSWEEVLGSWSSSNQGIATIKTFKNAAAGGEMRYKGDFVVSPTSDAKSGNKAASIQTQLTKESFLQMVTIPIVTSGSLFLGTFKTELSDRLKSTKFGIPYSQQPDRFKGWYKYAPGETYYTATKANGTTATTSDSIVDECSIFALLYEAETEDFVLTGLDIATSDKIISRAVLPDGSAKADWTYFDLPFEPVGGRTYDPTKSYKFTIVCSSSKNGDSFSGAPGSTLIVDDFEITVK